MSEDNDTATVRAGHTGHRRVLFEGEFFACFAFNKDHRGASRVWFDGMPMTLPKMPLSRAVDMADNVLAQAAYVAAKLAEGTNAGGGVTPREARRARVARHQNRPAPRHAHQDPAGSEWLAKVGAT